MIGIKDGKPFYLSGDLKDEMGKYIDSMVMFLSGISAKYAQSMSSDWDDKTTFNEHYESNLIFKNTINNSLEVMLKGFFDIGDVKGAPSQELRDVAVYDFMKNEILAHLRKRTKEEIVSSYSRYSIEACSVRTKELVTNYSDEDIGMISSIVEVNFADSLMVSNPFTPFLLREGQMFSQWRKSDNGKRITIDFIRIGIYLYFSGESYTPIMEEHLDAMDIPESFVELICFELDELTKEDFIQRLQKRIENGEVSH